MLYNLELRVPLKGNFETHGFLDTGNVFKLVIEIDFRELRSAVGLGVLYNRRLGRCGSTWIQGEPIARREPKAYCITFGRAF